jgi:hypothetical protein
MHVENARNGELNKQSVTSRRKHSARFRALGNYESVRPIRINLTLYYHKIVKKLSYLLFMKKKTSFINYKVFETDI